MEKLLVTDRTLKELHGKKALTFKEKIELARLIDRLQVDCIELPAMDQSKADSLLVKSISSAVRNAEVAVELSLCENSIQRTAAALAEAKRGRLQICVPLSTVQMEYLYHMKPSMMQKRLLETISLAKQSGFPVELIADDATRSDTVFLADTLNKAVQAGVDRITLRDSAGVLLPEEMKEFLQRLLSEVNGFSGLPIGFTCSNAIHMADACTVAALGCGVREVKLSTIASDCPSLVHVVSLLQVKGENLGVYSSVRTSELRHVTAQIARLCRMGSEEESIGTIKEENDETFLTGYDSRENVIKAVKTLGYELSEEDLNRIWTAFQTIVRKKEAVSYRELDAIVAAEALQVPAVWKAESYVINTGNVVSAMAHMKLSYRGELREGISLGDGAIAAAFCAIEKAIGRQYELDDFQIQSISEGREAVGRTVVKLRSDGKLYSGQGISTDIVGASIMAYINALNKIVYEEEGE